MSESRQNNQGGSRPDKAHDMNISSSNLGKKKIGKPEFQGMKPVQKAINTVNGMQEGNWARSGNRGRNIANNESDDYWQVSFPESIKQGTNQ